MVTNDPLEALFLTGFVPGLMIMVCMSLYAYFFCKRQDAVTMPLHLPADARHLHQVDSDPYDHPVILLSRTDIIA